MTTTNKPIQNIYIFAAQYKLNLSHNANYDTAAVQRAVVTA